MLIGGVTPAPDHLDRHVVDFGYPKPRLVAHGEGEIRFKLAAFELVLRGIYPSGRQIFKTLGRERRLRPNRRVALSGKECSWKRDVFELLGIKPSFAHMGHGPYWNNWRVELEKMEAMRKIEYRYERGPRGRLIRIDTEAARDAQEQRDAFFAWAGRPS